MATERNETLGIIGGMGPAAGCLFLQRLIDLHTDATGDADHPRVVLFSNPAIPDRLQAHLHGGRSPVDEIVGTAERLRAAGATFGIMACNSAHIWFDEIRERSPLELLSIHEALEVELANRALVGEAARVALLGTGATAASGLFRSEVAGAGCALVVPDAALQARIDATIFDPRYGIKATGWAVHAEARRRLEGIVEDLRRTEGVDTVILGCTELSLAVTTTEIAGTRTVDPLVISARRCLGRLLGDPVPV